MRVAILPTGETEWIGLSQAFLRLFPEHDFYCLPPKAVKESNGTFNGFTSNALSETHEQNPPEAAVELIEQAAQAGLRDKRRLPADLVLIVDDLELNNAHQPERVVSVMRRAVEKHLEGLREKHIRDQTRECLRAKVSFHLIAPLIEAWFFADPKALQKAGVPDGKAVFFGTEVDPESFKTTDGAYLKATEADCPCLDRKRPKKTRPKWLGNIRRDFHPKAYLQWLCLDPLAKTCTSYSETKSGGPALAGLSWEVLLKRPPAHFAFLRALIDDLEEGLEAIVPGSSRQVAELTRRLPRQTGLVLRNI